jgi:hypothetical protein
MLYHQKVLEIKKLVAQNKTTPQITATLGISANDFYNICRREDIAYNKIKSGGRTLGAKDINKRIRRKKVIIKKVKGGAEMSQLDDMRKANNARSESEISEYENYLNKKNVSDDIGKLCDLALTNASKPITEEDVANYDHNRFKA